MPFSGNKNWDKSLKVFDETLKVGAANSFPRLTPARSVHVKVALEDTVFEQHWKGETSVLRCENSKFTTEERKTIITPQMLVVQQENLQKSTVS